MKEDSLLGVSYVGIGRVVTLILQAVFYLFFAAILGPVDYGKLNLILALAGTFSIISAFGLPQTLQVYSAKKKSNTVDQLNTLFVILTIIAALILLLQDIFASILCLGLSLFMMNQRTLLGLRKYKKFMLNSILRGILFLSIPFGFYFVFEIPGIVLGLAISYIISSIPYYHTLRISSLSGLKNHYKVIIHNFGITASDSLPVMIDKLLIGFLFELFIVGVYQFNLQILLALGVLPTIVYSFLLSEESSGNSHKKLIYFSVIVSIVFAVLTFILAPFFVNNLFPEYIEGVFPLQVLGIAIIPMTISAILSAKLMSRESTKIGFSAVIRIGVMLGLIALFGEFYGLLGLSFAVLISIVSNTIFLSILILKK